MRGGRRVFLMITRSFETTQSSARGEWFSWLAASQSKVRRINRPIVNGRGIADSQPGIGFSGSRSCAAVLVSGERVCGLENTYARRGPRFSRIRVLGIFYGRWRQGRDVCGAGEGL